MDTFFAFINNRQKSQSNDVETNADIIKSTFCRLPDFSYSPLVTPKRRHSQPSSSHNDTTDSCSIKSSSSTSSSLSSNTSLSSFDDNSIPENKYVSFPSYENFASDCCWYDNEQRLLIKRETVVSELEMEKYDVMFVGDVRT
ncbi:1083_t:CDS:1 [Ambispora gerdemannii]|uniref:1083_t:CDS:1 n=1 Tax=Ambispora gerdemannii TaxID=144530 RepID=A0A9N9BSW0_9GLOM|nr:1083_t:CDS:1 [Ambispora gerdemannii]